MFKKHTIVFWRNDHWIGDVSGQVNYFIDTAQALRALEQLRREGRVDFDQPFSIDRIEDFRAVRLIAYFPPVPVVACDDASGEVS